MLIQLSERVFFDLIYNAYNFTSVYRVLRNAAKRGIAINDKTVTHALCVLDQGEDYLSISVAYHRGGRLLRRDTYYSAERLPR